MAGKGDAASGDIGQMQKLLNEAVKRMDDKALKGTLRGVMRSEAKHLRTIAVAGLRRSGIAHPDQLATEPGTKAKPKGIRGLVFNDKKTQCPALLVSVTPTHSSGYHVNRQGLKKPILRWVNSPAQTATRQTKRGYNRGKFPYAGTDYIGDAERALEQSGRRIVENFEKRVLKIANKFNNGH